MYDGGWFQLRSIVDNYVIVTVNAKGQAARQAQYYGSVDGLLYGLMDTLVKQKLSAGAPYREVKDFVLPIREAVAEVRGIGDMLKDAVRVDGLKGEV